MVQLATDTKRKLTNQVRQCPIEFNGFFTKENLNMLPLGSYRVLIGMEWLEKQIDVLNCLRETISCVNQDGKTQFIKGITKSISLRQITILQLKRSERK